MVDDDPPLLVALERQFRNAGMHPLTTSSIEGAWKVLSHHVVHCIVADERLGDGSGAEFLVDVGRSHRGVGRVLLTGFLDGYLTQRASECGFVALDKGCRFPEILAAVNREIGNG